jgi:hypothetical protein
MMFPYWNWLADTHDETGPTNAGDNILDQQCCFPLLLIAVNGRKLGDYIVHENGLFDINSDLRKTIL